MVLACVASPGLSHLLPKFLPTCQGLHRIYNLEPISKCRGLNDLQDLIGESDGCAKQCMLPYNLIRHNKRNRNEPLLKLHADGAEEAPVPEG